MLARHALRPRWGVCRPASSYAPRTYPNSERGTTRDQTRRSCSDTPFLATYLTGANVADFSTQVRTRATEGTSQLSYLIEELDRAYQRLGMAPGAGDRLTSAQVLRSLLEKLHTTSGNVAVCSFSSRLRRT